MKCQTCFFVVSASFPCFQKTYWMKFLLKTRSSRLEVFCKEVVLENFAEFPGKHLHMCFPFNFATILRTPFFMEHLPLAAYGRLTENLLKHLLRSATFLKNKSKLSNKLQCMPSSWVLEISRNILTDLSFSSKFLQSSLIFFSKNGFISSSFRSLPAGIYLFEISNWNARTMREMWSNLTIKTSERHKCRLDPGNIGLKRTHLLWKTHLPFEGLEMQKWNIPRNRAHLSIYHVYSQMSKMTLYLYFLLMNSKSQS